MSVCALQFVHSNQGGQAVAELACGKGNASLFSDDVLISWACLGAGLTCELPRDMYAAVACIGHTWKDEIRREMGCGDWRGAGDVAGEREELSGDAELLMQTRK